MYITSMYICIYTKLQLVFGKCRYDVLESSFKTMIVYWPIEGLLKHESVHVHPPQQV